MTIRKFAKTAALATLAIALSASSALSVEAVSTIGLNVRSGPGTNHAVVDQLHSGETVDVVECNPAGTWCRIFHEGPDGWVSAKYLGAPGSGGNSGGNSGGGNDAAKAAALAAIIGIGAAIIGGAAAGNNPPPPPPPAPPPPPPPLPYGPDTCKQGFVWRDAIPGDHVCVTGASRSQAAHENAIAGSRVDPNGAYGPNTCKQGFVWREAYNGDVVCVTGARRSQVRQENIDGPSHRVQP